MKLFQILLAVIEKKKDIEVGSNFKTAAVFKTWNFIWPHCVARRVANASVRPSFDFPNDGSSNFVGAAYTTASRVLVRSSNGQGRGSSSWSTTRLTLE